MISKWVSWSLILAIFVGTSTQEKCICQWNSNLDSGRSKHFQIGGTDCLSRGPPQSCFRDSLNNQSFFFPQKREVGNLAIYLALMRVRVVIITLVRMQQKFTLWYIIFQILPCRSNTKHGIFTSHFVLQNMHVMLLLGVNLTSMDKSIFYTSRASHIIFILIDLNVAKF